MIDRVKDALKRGFDVLDSAYELVEEEVVESPHGGCTELCIFPLPHYSSHLHTHYYHSSHLHNHHYHSSHLHTHHYHSSHSPLSLLCRRGRGEGELVATIRPEPIMQLRDPYSERLFPSIIGTQDFYQSERLGLVEYISDGEECMHLYRHQGNSAMYSIPSPTSSSL